MLVRAQLEPSPLGTKPRVEIILGQGWVVVRSNTYSGVAFFSSPANET